VNLPAACSVKRAVEAATECNYLVPLNDVRGKLPLELRGTFLRIGPGQYKVGGQPIGHAFDGDGMLHSVAFTDAGVHYRNRFVRTRKYVAETQAQRILFRTLGHNAPGGPFKNLFRYPANCANTNVTWHAGHLLALWEGGRPYALDPATLETLGEFDYDGCLNKLDNFSAHGKIDPRTGHYYNFGISVGRSGPSINLYRINPHGHLDRKGHIAIGYLPFCHDFALTEHYAVFTLGSLHARNPVKALFGRETYMDALQFEPERPARMVVVSLVNFEVVRSFETDAFFPVHYSNCWEEGGELFIHLSRFTNARVFDALAHPGRNGAFANLGPGQKSALWRYRLNLATGAVRYEALPGHDYIEFMQWDHRRTGLRSRFTYSNAALPHPGSRTFNAIQRQNHENGDHTLYDFGLGSLISEAVFVPRHNSAAEDDGYLITAVYRAATHTTDIVVLHAATLDELAVVPLSSHIPAGFHSGYTSKAFLR
jgi:all-trans-8'-apo-beta-carotenal 15,15'-oxygenase